MRILSLMGQSDEPQKAQNELYFAELTVEQRRWLVSEKNTECEFQKFIGNELAIRRLRRAAFAALGRSNHTSDQGLSFIGPASTGKTTLAKLYAQFLGLPFISAQPQSLQSVQDVFNAIKKVLQEPFKTQSGEVDLALVDQNGKYVIPPCIVFIDEVHNLKKDVVQGLLKATEQNDAELVTEDGTVADTSNICWIIATTDRGDLFDAFDTRFDKIQLRLYSKAEMTKIIRTKNKDWSWEQCQVVAHYCSVVPREALSFANDVRTEKEMNPEKSWTEVAATVATDHGIDEYGMTIQRLSVLEALGQRPISAKQMPNYVQPRCKEEELQNYVMPALLAVTPDQPHPLVIVGSKGYTITRAGLAELNRRGLKNKGVEAIPVAFR